MKPQIEHTKKKEQPNEGYAGNKSPRCWVAAVENVDRDVDEDKDNATLARLKLRAYKEVFRFRPGSLVVNHGR